MTENEFILNLLEVPCMTIERTVTGSLIASYGASQIMTFVYTPGKNGGTVTANFYRGKRSESYKINSKQVEDVAYILKNTLTVNGYDMAKAACKRK